MVRPPAQHSRWLVVIRRFPAIKPSLGLVNYPIPSLGIRCKGPGRSVNSAIRPFSLDKPLAVQEFLQLSGFEYGLGVFSCHSADMPDVEDRAIDARQGRTRPQLASVSYRIEPTRISGIPATGNAQSRSSKPPSSGCIVPSASLDDRLCHLRSTVSLPIVATARSIRVGKSHKVGRW
jgi:hypothetical protein